MRRDQQSASISERGTRPTLQSCLDIIKKTSVILADEKIGRAIVINILRFHLVQRKQTMMSKLPRKSIHSEEKLLEKNNKRKWMKKLKELLSFKGRR